MVWTPDDHEYCWPIFRTGDAVCAYLKMMEWMGAFDWGYKGL